MGTSLARLKRRPEFLRAASAGHKCVTPGLILQARPHSAAERQERAIAPRRVGFTVSRKVGSAVVRNRVRRRLRSVADRVLAAHGMGECDYVIIGRQATAARPFPALERDMETALRKLDAYRDGERADPAGAETAG